MRFCTALLLKMYLFFEFKLEENRGREGGNGKPGALLEENKGEGGVLRRFSEGKTKRT